MPHGNVAPGNSVGVIGAGAYGTALACAVARAGRDVVLYVRGAENAAQMKATRKNPKLPGVILDERIGITAELAIAARADIILMATPAQNLREVRWRWLHSSDRKRLSSPAPRASNAARICS